MTMGSSSVMSVTFGLNETKVHDLFIKLYTDIKKLFTETLDIF